MLCIPFTFVVLLGQYNIFKSVLNQIKSTDIYQIWCAQLKSNIIIRHLKLKIALSIPGSIPASHEKKYSQIKQIQVVFNHLKLWVASDRETQLQVGKKIVKITW